MLYARAHAVVGWVATIACCFMYISYIPLILDNLHGVKTNPLQPLAAAVNCVLWVTYGLLSERKNWPIVIANSPGIVLGLITFSTGL
ncbi:hypothetical protein PO654_26805 [Phytobacter diazotrophicus]|jgi:uncharacterized protein with PQ loop repeat|uniref:Sugar efflux transporter for intercellular exchange n=2 Tax=Enterobacteriaceae TaxID=543 RepID=A0ABW1Q734_9ENTR|nr:MULTISPECIES: hypothetical protein [Enterobacteriaceae]AUU87774.1 hypothetical protein C2U55_01095 [Enterobacteriaceae bacterium ENNIH3]AUV06932.1 hypothetical protein C2U52_11860 [Enterobacteriaceae bacterium ENNIH2]MBS6741510.1 hypothetical protein [Enterobacteriaceae bacterium]MDU4242256.1 hypothetical protein [Bifidobacterium longum]PTA94521.1 hypothetical protein C9415_16470 [Kluyvera sp. Nf5]PXW54866.1 sugar efflux transporter for intercellular exchange [Grimontella sp. AG753]QIH617